MATISSINSLSAKTGIGGLASGMDIDELVKNLTIASRQKILKQQQTVQKLEWKQTGYRSVTKALTQFQSSYLDLLSATNFRSASFFNTVKASSSSAAVSATATAAAKQGSITIDSITQLAKKQKTTSGATVSKALVGTLASETPGSLSGDDISSLVSSIGGKSISLVLDGRLKTVTFDSEFVQSASADPTQAGLENALQKAVDKAFGVIHEEDRMINVSLDGDKLFFSAEGSQLIARTAGDDIATLESLGLSDGQSNKLSLYHPLHYASLAADLDPDTDFFEFSINSVEFKFYKGVALADVMREIESSDAGVTIAYSSISDSFTLTAKETGAGENIKIEETQGNLLSALGLTAESGAKVEYGQNAILRVNGKDIIRTSNNVNVDGVSIELLQDTKENPGPITINLQEDSSTLIEPIKKFIEDYNSLLDLMNGLVSEPVYSKFQPLSEEEKGEMTEKQIEQWEEKAKSGLLRNDPVLKGIVSELRTVMIGAAKKGGITLYDMGISSGSYQDYGKLKITKEGEAKLIEALKTRGADVAELFSAAGTGLAHRVNDIIQSATKTSGPQNQRGKLIDLAGIESTSSHTENSISDTIKNANKRLEALQIRLTAEESRLWRKFTAMEKALEKLNSQSAILAQFSSSK